MTDQSDNLNPPEVDPIRDAAETLLYGDPELAGEKLRTAIRSEASKIHAHQGRLRSEQARSQADLRQFKDENPEFMANLQFPAARSLRCAPWA